MGSVCDALSSDDAYVYQMSLNYLEQLRGYGWDKLNFDCDHNMSAS